MGSGSHEAGRIGGPGHRMRCVRTLAVVGAIGMALLVWLVSSGPHLACHRALACALMQWQEVTTNADWYPNVAGSGAASLEELMPHIKDGERSLRDYRYVPGLKADDPAALVMMYLRAPSWRTWHGDQHWVRSQKRWVILNPQLSDHGESYGSEWSELGEAITTAEFTNRLTATLEYLRENRRPNWEAATDEHARFLHSIGRP